MFNAFDWVILGITAFLFVMGVIKGFLKQLFAFLGIVVVFSFGSVLAPYAQGWLESIITDASLRSLVAMIASYLVLFIVWSLVTGLIVKILEKNGVISFLNRVLGGLLGVACMYVICAVVFALILNTAEGFLPSVKNLVKPLIEGDSPSWLVTNIFSAENNKLGEFIVSAFIDKINEILPSTDPSAFAACALVL